MRYEPWGPVKSVSTGAAAVTALIAAAIGVVSMQFFAFILMPFIVCIGVRLAMDHSLRVTLRDAQARDASSAETTDIRVPRLT